MTTRWLVYFLLATLSAIPAGAQTGPPVLKIEAGGTGANNAATARANLGAAAAGANNDITSLNGLTTVLPPSEGGTGTTSGVSPTGSLTTTPEAVINVADYGGCSGSTSGDTANLNNALAAARNSTAYTNNQPVQSHRWLLRQRHCLRRHTNKCHRICTVRRRRATHSGGPHGCVLRRGQYLPRRTRLTEHTIQPRHNHWFYSLPADDRNAGRQSLSVDERLLHTHTLWA